MVDFFGAAVDGRGMVERVENSAFPAAPVEYEYDSLDRMVGRTIGGSGNSASWQFDAAGRVSTWTNPLGTFTPNYLHATYGVSRLDKLPLPNGQEVDFDWEPATGDFRLKEILTRAAGGGSVVNQFNYQTDATGQIREWVKQSAGSAGRRMILGYNRVDEVTSAVIEDTGTNQMVSHEAYRFDRAGNRSGWQKDAEVFSGAYNDLNQLTGISRGGMMRFRGTLNEPGRVTVNGTAAWMEGGTKFQADINLPPGNHTVAVVATDANNHSRTNQYLVTVPGGASRSLAYDGNGNLRNDGQRQYEWDAWNRLKKVTQGSDIYEWEYDVLGQRVAEKKNGVLIKRWLWAGGLAPAEERNAAGTLTKRFYGDGVMEGATKVFYSRDHLGSIRSLSNASGAVTATYDYGVWGERTLLSGTDTADFGFTGHYTHRETGLVLAKYRAYDPGTARWLSRDPIGEAGGINLYGYVSNNPINMVDPLGLAYGPYPGVWVPTTPAETAAWTRGNAVASAAAAGIGVGVAGTAVVAYAAPAAVSGLTAVGVPLQTAQAAVTGAVMAGGSLGAVALGYNTWGELSNGNYEGAAFNLGSLAGGLMNARLPGRMLSEGISRCPTSAKPGLFGDSHLGFDPNHPNFSLLGWLASGPTPQMGAASASFLVGGAGSMTLGGWISNE